MRRAHLGIDKTISLHIVDGEGQRDQPDEPEADQCVGPGIRLNNLLLLVFLLLMVTPYSSAFDYLNYYGLTSLRFLFKI